MKNSISFLLIGFLISSVLIFSSCDPKKKENPDKTIEVTNDILMPTTWESGNTYEIKKADFYISSTLTIQAGVTVIIPAQRGHNKITLSNSGKAKGKIIANGTSSEPIVFASLFSKKDYSLDIPKENHWGTLDLNGTSGSIFNNCNFYHGGHGTDATAVLALGNGKNDITNCIFAYSGGGERNSFFIGALDARQAPKGTIIKNNRFYGNTLPLTIGLEIDIDDSNSFSNKGVDNVLNAIYTSGGSINKDTFWGETEVAFVITSSSINIVKDLKLADNVVIKFMHDTGLYLIDSEQRIINHNGKGVFFTSIKDDEHKGDSNGDSNSTKAAPADWRGIFLDNTRYYLQWPNILYNDENATT